MKVDPLILKSIEDQGQQLIRFVSEPGKEIQEKWIQQLIFNHPEILPVSYFDESCESLIPVARELSTDAGSIDNFYISPKGTLVIVETKLWKNPEMHRKVLAQVIDYAKELSRWTYEDLDNAVISANSRSGSNANISLDNIVQDSVKEVGLDLIDFKERVIQNLLSGEIILLIVGDKIAPNLVFLSDYLSNPGLTFKLGLIEMQIYKLEDNSDWPIVVIPDIVGRIVDKTRGVVKIQYKEEKPDVETMVVDEIKPGKKGKTGKDEFLMRAPQHLSGVFERWLDLWERMRLRIYWGTMGFSLRIVYKGKIHTIIDAYPHWPLALIRDTEAEKIGIPRDLHYKYLKAIREIHSVSMVLSSKKKYIVNPDSITEQELDEAFQATTNLIDQLMMLE